MNRLSGLLEKHRSGIDRLQNGHPISQGMYEDFYDHYGSTGQLPYTAMKAVTVDPYVWVARQILWDAHRLPFNQKE